MNALGERDAVPEMKEGPWSRHVGAGFKQP